jgi:hypothetical protein
MGAANSLVKACLQLSYLQTCLQHLLLQQVSTTTAESSCCAALPQHACLCTRLRLSAATDAVL